MTQEKIMVTSGEEGGMVGEASGIEPGSAALSTQGHLGTCGRGGSRNVHKHFTWKNYPHLHTYTDIICICVHI